MNSAGLLDLNWSSAGGLDVGELSRGIDRVVATVEGCDVGITGRSADTLRCVMMIHLQYN